MFESITDYDQRLALARKILQDNQGYLPPDKKFALAQDIAALAAPGWEWMIRKWIGKYKYGQKSPRVDGRTIVFDSKTTLAELAAIIIHKTDHMVMGHQERRGDRDEKIWNVAACLEDIRRWKEVFEQLGIALPEKIDPSRTIKDLPREEAEKLYDMIDPQQAQQTGTDNDPDQQQDGNQQPGPSGQGQPGDGQPGDGQPGDGQPGDGQPGDGAAQGQGKPSQEDLDNAANCELSDDNYDQTMMDPADGMGQGQDGQGQDGDGQPGDGDGQGEGKDGNGKPSGKPGPAGQNPGDQQRQVDSRQPYTSLMRLIRRRLNLGNNRMNFTLRRPSSRSDQTNGGVLSRLDNAPDSLRIVVDTSASLSEELLKSIFRTVSELERTARRDGEVSRTVFGHGDTKLRDVGNASKMKTIIAGGGTDMKTVIDEAMRHPKMRNGTAWVIITDGESHTWPDRLPRNTVVILVNAKLQTGQAPPEEIRLSQWTTYKIPEHIRRAAVCISMRDFIAGGQVQPPGRQVA